MICWVVQEPGEVGWLKAFAFAGIGNAPAKHAMVCDFYLRTVERAWKWGNGSDAGRVDFA